MEERNEGGRKERREERRKRRRRRRKRNRRRRRKKEARSSIGFNGFIEHQLCLPPFVARFLFYTTKCDSN
jgi:hypothetical protein